MAEPNIKTGGYTNNNSNIRTAKSTGVNTEHLSDNLSGWIGEPDTNSTTDTGIEAVNVAVLPAAKKVAGKAVNKVVDSLVEKATSSIAAPERYKVSPSSMNTIRKNVSTEHESVPNAVRARKEGHKSNTSSGIRTSRQYVLSNRLRTGGRSIALPSKVKTRQQRNHTGQPVSAIKMTGRYINENAKLSLKGYAFQGNTTFKRFYATNAKIDKESTTNTGKEIIQGTRIAVKTGRNAVIGVENTVRGAKKTYKVGRQIYIKTKTVVRNTSKTIKSIKNAKSSVEKVKIATRAFVNSLKAVVNTVKALANPLVLKGLAIIAAVLLLLVIMSGTVQAVVSIINSNFGWLYNPSDPTQTVDTVLDGHKTKIVGFIDDVNTNYTKTINNHTGYEYGFHDTGSEYSVKTNIYKDILAILIVYKQKLHGFYGNTDPNGVYDLTNVTFNDNEIKDVLNRFYTFSTRSGTYYCSGCDCNGHSGSHSFPSCYTLNCSSSHTYYCSGCTCPSGHSALYVKIVNHSKESVMATLGFTPEEIERATLISQYLDDIEAGNY